MAPGLPAPVISSGNTLTVIFHTDSSVSRRGWKAGWVAVPSPAEAHLITSPGFPSNYPKNHRSVVNLTAPPGSRVQLIFSDVDIEYSVDCQWDSLIILDGSDETAPSLGRLCGQLETLASTTFTSSSGSLTLVFSTDSSASLSGYRATWQAVP